MEKYLMVGAGDVSTQQMKALVESEDYTSMIAVDGGMQAFYDLGIVPDLLIGDFDSVSPRVLKHFLNLEVYKEAFPTKKDMTDSELAIGRIGQKMKAGDRLDLLGMTGSRLDHTLANIFLLERFAALNMRILQPTNLMCLARSSMIIPKNGFQYISLVPLSDEVRGITISGVAYPLLEHILKRGDTLGVSNEILELEAQLSFEEGILMVVQSNDKIA